MQPHGTTTNVAVGLLLLAACAYAAYAAYAAHAECTGECFTDDATILQVEEDAETLSINNEKFSTWSDMLTVDDPNELKNIPSCQKADPTKSYSENRAIMASCTTNSVPPMLRTMLYMADQQKKAANLT